MKKWITCLMLLLITIVPVTVIAEETGWDMSVSAEVTEEVQELFDHAMEELVGVDYTPVAVLGKSGGTYCILCKAAAVYPGAAPYNALVYVNEEGIQNIYELWVEQHAEKEEMIEDLNQAGTYEEQDAISDGAESAEAEATETEAAEAEVTEAEAAETEAAETEAAEAETADEAAADETAESDGAEADTDIQYVMYLGTNDKETNQPVFTQAESLEKVKEILIRHFGGFTIQEANGGWVDGETLYQEYTLVLYLSDTTKEAVHAAADEMIETFHQSSVLIQANPTKTEFYSGK